jgi:hypothetical protein
LSKSSKKYGLGIRDPRSGKNLFRIPDPGVKKAPDPGVKKAPDPGSGSATLLIMVLTVGILTPDFKDNML